jgi:ADP-ribose pyrophosphatase YjhB (NUDIX family)
MAKAPKLVADVLVTAMGRALLVRYADVSKYDGQHGWFLPDDYLTYGEHPLDAAGRILREQLGLNLNCVSLGFIESFGAEEGGQWHLAFHYRLMLGDVPAIQPAGNIAAAEWFHLDNLPAPELVAHHGWALDVIRQMPDPQ